MSRKLFITLILILFLLPFVSWYYLQQGLNWRKEAQDVMNGKEAFPEGEWSDLHGKKLSNDQLENHVTLVARLSCDDKQENSMVLEKFYDQFKETKKANFILLDSCYSGTANLDSAKIDWYVFSCQDTTDFCRLLSAAWPAGKTHALVDRNKIIRSYYHADTEDEKRVLLEHMALLLPRDRSEKVELKRGIRK